MKLLLGGGGEKKDFGELKIHFFKRIFSVRSVEKVLWWGEFVRVHFELPRVKKWLG